MEIINTILLQVKGMPGTGQILSSQDKYVGRIQQSIAGGIDASFEPLLEKHIGKIVIAVVLKGNENVRLRAYSGVYRRVYRTAQRYVPAAGRRRKVRRYNNPEESGYCAARRRIREIIRKHGLATTRDFCLASTNRGIIRKHSLGNMGNHRREWFGEYGEQ